MRSLTASKEEGKKGLGGGRTNAWIHHRSLGDVDISCKRHHRNVMRQFSATKKGRGAD